MPRTRLLTAGLVAIVALAASSGASVAHAATPTGSGAIVVAPRGAVPFRGRFVVSATWGATTGATHDTPAIDFVMPIGTPVYAAGSGVVDFTSNDPRNCNPSNHIPAGGTYAQGIQWCLDRGLNGTRIRIHHDDGTFTMYVHLSAIRTGISASPASRVRAGQLIGWSGNSGISTGPHLHFSRINTAGTATIDPGILHACWGAGVHNYGHLQQLRGTVVRNDAFTC
jgi:murein DD-endopeptidase MepM/ murein hydrolase activator NlpD